MVASPKPGEHEVETWDMASGVNHHHLYRQAVGKLRYAVSERPDLSYVVKELSRGRATPRGQHRAMLKRCLRYAQGGQAPLVQAWWLQVEQPQHDGLLGRVPAP